MAARQFTRMEQVGILVAVVVIATFGYLKFINADPGRKLKRVKRKYAKIAAEVDKLKEEDRSGSVKREIRRLRKRIAKAESKLEETEILLAQREEKDRLANTVVRMATESRLLIKTFSEVTGSSDVKALSSKNTPYEHRYFNLELKGPFQSLRQFLDKIDDFPKLIAVRKLDIQKLESEAYMRADLLIGI
ncbi:MAG: hypothetical protein CR984_03490 [Proteobacteria bacterium]|nr:MAG: hypothetical protein CR984_03490 [Pseudomonadota bacterium]